MNQNMKDLIKWVIQTAQGSGSSESAAQLSVSREVNIRYREGKPEIVKEASKQVLSLKIYSQGKYSVHSTPDLRKSTLGDFINKQIQNTAYLEEDPFRSLPDPAYYSGKPVVDLQKTDPAYGGFSVEQRHEKVREMEEACIEKGND